MATYLDAINDGETTLANTLSAAETTQIVVADGSKLPVGGSSTSGFIVKLEDNLGNIEYILCSSRSGNTVFIATSGRGYEGTSARQWLSGSYIKNVFTKATKDELSGAVGDRLYTEENYVTDSEDITESIDQLDMGLFDTDNKIGNLSSLTTTDKSSTVNAINEVDSELTSHLAENVHLGLNACVKVNRSVTQSIANSTTTTLAFDVDIFNDYGMHDVASQNSRIVCTQAGKYIIGANIRWDTNATGYRLLQIRKNGSITVASDVKDFTASVGVDTQNLDTMVDLNVGDYIEVMARQNSGGL